MPHDLVQGAANQPKEGDWLEEYEGQLAIDVYQNEDAVVLRAPIAGVSVDDLEISITEEVITIRGQRKDMETVSKENYFCQECYWGNFSRSYILPMVVDAEKADASLKDGILTIRIPKLEKTKTRVLKIKTL